MAGMRNLQQCARAIFVAAICLAAGIGCSSTDTGEPAASSDPKLRQLGVIEGVQLDGDFVVYQRTSNIHLPVGTKVRWVPRGADETDPDMGGRLEICPQRRGQRAVADILSGEPSVGDLLWLPHDAKPKEKPSDTDDSSKPADPRAQYVSPQDETEFLEVDEISVDAPFDGDLPPLRPPPGGAEIQAPERIASPRSIEPELNQELPPITLPPLSDPPEFDDLPPLRPPPE